jgi:phosphomethylpyrimidine synthase
MNKNNGSKESKAAEAPLPNSKKVYVSGKLYTDIRVPFREISLAATKSMNGEIEVNEPVCVYDTSGPWGDPDFHGDVTRGLPPLRGKWIRDRSDVEEYDGRKVQPIDDGYLSVAHAEHSAKRNGSKKEKVESRKYSSFIPHPSSFAARKPLRAKPGKVVTQLAYARQGIITPEMEFIAIRENHRLQRLKEEGKRKKGEQSEILNSSFLIRNSLLHQHPGDSFGAAIPKEITPEFVR